MNWEEIRKEYETSSITMKELAEKHNVNQATLRSRKNRDKWLQRNAIKKVATKHATQRKNVATQKVTENAKKVLNETDIGDWEDVYCLEYLKHFNMTKAYQKAKPGTKYDSARILGSRTFAKVNIQKRLKELKEAQRNDLYIDSLDIKREWAKQAFADVKDYVVFGKREEPLMGMFGPVIDKKGKVVTHEVNYVDFKEGTELDGSIIKEVRKGKDGPIVQLYDKQKAMQELLKLMSDNEDSNGGVVFLDNEEAMNQYMAKHGEAYAD